MQATVTHFVRLAAGGDSDAFARLVGICEPAARTAALAVLGDPAAASDVVQDAFFRAWRRLGDLREPERFGPWLCGIARNLAIDRLRRRRRVEPLSDSAAAADSDRWTHDPLEDACLHESRQMVAGAIAQLDETARRAVTMRYYDSLPSRRIADVLGISPDAVDMRLIRARRRLRDTLPAECLP